ncbi:hypothetical protein SacmaDRAFT_0624 [Saccharomonospora marina XMU15]|uniref:Uncharacterized protein n=1 Tax=Saccharomonospora marina XMU15 TaxID=882083 RepID=H5X5B3_9PSEU|nr:hypothetical protein [Saccharomonospora marina]EHR48924.1 hypothetical protein SacmaDRAFT_0624 [Saccharomonospora marina XMU15]
MSELNRPEPASAELAARAGHGSRADVVASAVGYWTPEIAATAAVGGGGAWLLHPAVLPVAGALLAARIVAARVARHRAQRALLKRQESERTERAARRAAGDHTHTTATEATEREGIA